MAFKPFHPLPAGYLIGPPRAGKGFLLAGRGPAGKIADVEQARRATMTEPADNVVLYRRVLYPHRSAGGIVLFRVLLIVAMVLTAVSMSFIALGAWPVSGFLGLEVVLLGAAFWVSEKRLNMRETIDLTQKVLIVERIDSRGRRQRWTFQPHWLYLRSLDRDGRSVGLELRSHGNSLVVGAYLTGDEISDLRRTLEEALRRLSAPLPQPA
jgi:uncharacterized membrane protein